MTTGKIQSVLVPKDMFTKPQAEQYIFKNFKLKKIDETEHFYRFRQLEPKPLENNGYQFKNKVLDNGVVLIIAYRDWSVFLILSPILLK